MVVFGPVKSRRLGLSLGVELVPKKVCSMDCVYCEVGRTSLFTLKRSLYIPFESIREELSQASKKCQYDVVTLTGSGEPTLNTCFREVVRFVKKELKAPLAVLTNSSLLEDEDVFEALCEADFVLASLDAADDEVLRRVNRPAKGISVKNLVSGLKKLRAYAKGRLWLEVLLVKGINDHPLHLKTLRRAIEEITPHRVQLNTVVRPPAEPFAKALTQAELREAAEVLGRNCEVITQRRAPKTKGEKVSERDILEYLKRRPSTPEELSSSFGVNIFKVEEILSRLLKESKVKTREFNQVTYFLSSEP